MLGASINRERRYSRRRSPPESFPMGWPWSWVGKRKRSIIWVAEKFPSRVFTWPATSWMKSYTRWRGSSSRPSWEK